MKIAQLSPVGPAHGRGGVQDIVMGLCVGLVQRGHDVTLVTTGRGGGAASEVVDGVQVEYLTTVPPMRAIGAWEHVSRGCLERLARERGAFHVIHSQSFCGLHLIGAWPGVPVVASLHGTHWDELRTRAGLIRESLPAHPAAGLKATALWGLMLARYLNEGPRLKRADGVIATSVEQRQVLLERYGVNPSRMHDVWNGIDAQLFSPRAADAALRARLAPEEAPIVLAVARLYQEKGIHHALRAFQLVLRLQPRATFVIVGDGPYRASLEALARELGIAEHVRFVGSVALAELPAYYAACDVFVNPTVRINGYDLTILQAMAHAKPVVVSDIGSVPTAVTADRDGLLAPPGDAAALAAQLTRVLGDAALAARLGAEARRTIEARFSVGAMVDGTLNAYSAAQRIATGARA